MGLKAWAQAQMAYKPLRVDVMYRTSMLHTISTDQ